MMVVAFVLVQVETGRAGELVQKIRALPGVAETYLVAGPHDILVKVVAEKFETVAQTVTERIHKLQGIKNTLTLFAFE
jgi:Lrp/AsnC family leucine-responsive transcriptional regulator